MASKLSRSVHLPRPRRLGIPPLGCRPRGGSGAPPLTCRTLEPPPSPGQAPLERGTDWRRWALRDGMVVALLTGFLTSAVLAAPDAFRQSPVLTWRQLASPALVMDQAPGDGVLVDCP
jgi:hypothetical protein